MSKITVSTVEMKANVQVINVNAYLITKIVKAQVLLENLLRGTIGTQQEYREVEEGKKDWVDILDENGKPVPQYRNVDSEPLHKEILPLLDELVAAFEE